MNVEGTFESKFNELMAAFGYIPDYIPKVVQPVEKFREHIWWEFQAPEESPAKISRALEDAEIELQGFGYNDFYRNYFKQADGTHISLTEKNGDYYEEIENETSGQYETGDEIIDTGILLKADDGKHITCGAHYNWFHFSLSKVRVKEFEECWWWA